MPKVMHLSDNFHNDFTKITTYLQEGLPPKDYKKFYEYLKRKDLSGATRFLEDILDERGSISFHNLALLRKKIQPWNSFYRYVVDRIEYWQWHTTITVSWIHLMAENGGSKRATKLVRKDHDKLPAPKPGKIIVKK